MIIHADDVTMLPLLRRWVRSVESRLAATNISSPKDAICAMRLVAEGLRLLSRLQKEVVKTSEDIAHIAASSVASFSFVFTTSGSKTEKSIGNADGSTCAAPGVAGQSAAGIGAAGAEAAGVAGAAAAGSNSEGSHVDEAVSSTEVDNTDADVFQGLVMHVNALCARVCEFVLQALQDNPDLAAEYADLGLLQQLKAIGGMETNLLR